MPSHLGPYSLGKRLGAGGMGEVWASRTPDGREVAIKTLRPELATHPEIRRRFSREARAAAALHHPNIVHLIDYGSEIGSYFLVMERVQGTPLRDWRRTPPPAEVVQRIFDQLLDALAHAHACGVVHRDLKPENVFCAFNSDNEPQAKVLDFGVVQFRGERDIQSPNPSAILGTPAYMAPEQGLALSDTGPATDLYAVGVMLFEILSGSRPYGGEGAVSTLMAHLRDPIPTLKLRPGYKAEGELQLFIERLLAKDPRERFLFAKDARQALQKIRLWGTPTLEPADDVERIDIETDFDTAQALETRDETGSGPSLHTPSGGIETWDASTLRLFELRDPPWIDGGKDSPLPKLCALVQEGIRSGQGTVIIVNGTLGSGKSRLLKQLRFLLEIDGIAQVWEGAHDGRAAGPDVGLRLAVRHGLGLSRLTPAELQKRLGEILSRQGVEDSWEARELTALLQTDSPIDCRSIMDVARSAALIRRTLAREVRRRPVVVTVDDAHMGSGEPVRTLTHMLQSGTESFSWVAVLTNDPGAGSTPHEDALQELRDLGAPRVQELLLEPMSARQITEIVSNYLPGGEEVADIVALRSEGNPLVATEFVRHLVRTGLLTGSSLPTEQAIADELSSAIGKLAHRRIKEAAGSPGADKFTPSVWERLAFLGLRFPLQLAHAAMERAAVSSLAPNEDSLERAIETGLLTGIFNIDDNETLRFESQIIRNSLIADASAAGRASELHLAAAGAKVAFYAHSLDARASEIAAHYTQAGVVPEALDFWMRGARYAQLHRRHHRALEAYGAVGKLAASHPDRDRLRLEAAIGLAETQLQRSAYHQALSHADAAENYARSHGMQIPLALIRLRARVALKTGALQKAWILFNESATLAVPGSDDELEALVGLGMVSLRESRLKDATRYFRAAREAFRERGDAQRSADALRDLAHATARAGQHREAQALALVAFAEFSELGDRHGRALCELTLAAASRSLGNYDEAEQLDLRAHNTFEAVGDWHSAAVAVLGAGQTAAMSNRNNDAEARFTEARHAFERLGDPWGRAVASLALGHVLARNQRWSEAERLIEEALEQDERARIDNVPFTEELVDLATLAKNAGKPELARRLIYTARFKLRRFAPEAGLDSRALEAAILLRELEEPRSP